MRPGNATHYCRWPACGLERSFRRPPCFMSSGSFRFLVLLLFVFLVLFFGVLFLTLLLILLALISHSVPLFPLSLDFLPWAHTASQVQTLAVLKNTPIRPTYQHHSVAVRSKDVCRSFTSSSIKKMSVSSVRRCMDAFRLSINWELSAG